MRCSCSSFSFRWEPYKKIFFFFFWQANALIYLSFSCMFIHSMFMTYEILTVPLMKCCLYQCRMSSSAPCMYVCNKDVLKIFNKQQQQNCFSFALFLFFTYFYCEILLLPKRKCRLGACFCHLLEIRDLKIK